MKRRFSIALFLATLLVLILSSGCTGRLAVVAKAWPEADRLFRSDDSWLGADDAYSVDLGRGRVLWLFGDTFIADDETGARKDADIIRNSIGIQYGYNPEKANIHFYWRRPDSQPGSFFPEQAEAWFWPGDGALVQGRLIVFLMKIIPADNELGFRADGWDACLIENPTDYPPAWRLKRVLRPRNSFGVMIGSAEVFTKGDYLYAFGSNEQPPQEAYLVRWPLTEVLTGDLSDPEWLTGSGWVRQSGLSQKPAPNITEAPHEFSVHYEPSKTKYLQIQTIGFGSAELAFRSAADFAGPWTTPQVFYRPEEWGRNNILIYASKAHPELKGADRVITYATNSLDFDDLLSDDSLYYPRFLKSKITQY